MQSLGAASDASLTGGLRTKHAHQVSHRNTLDHRLDEWGPTVRQYALTEICLRDILFMDGKHLSHTSRR